MDKKKVGRWIGTAVLCVAVNLIGRAAASVWNLPFWLDMVGTCLASYYLGILGGAAVGVANNVLLGIRNPVSFAYAAASLVAALGFGLCAKKGYFKSLSKLLVCSFWVAVTCVCICTPLNLLLNQGYSGNLWGDALVDMMDWYGMPKLLSALAGETIVEIVDKQVVVLLAYGILHFLQGWKQRKDTGRGFRKKAAGKLLALLLSCGLAAGLFMPLGTLAEEGEEDISSALSDFYISKIYNNSNGMMSSEANVIEETEDGMIWIGSYAGLTRYDGQKFTFIREGGITNVNCMMTDQKGRLWIGTNDGGIARYEDGSFTFFGTEDGLSADSVRAFAEGEDGTVYVGTTDRLCVVDEADRISVLESEEVYSYVVSLAVYDGLLVGTDHDGKLFAVEEETGQSLKVEGLDASLFCNCVKKVSQGLLAGTSGQDVYLADHVGDRLLLEKKYQVRISGVERIEEDSSGRIWVCGGNGIGFFSESGNFVEEHYEDFDASLAWLHEDYQGNMWVASSRYGVMELVKSKFQDVFKKAGIESQVVNAVTFYNGDYYCGTDEGLLVLSGQDLTLVDTPAAALLEGERVRSLMVDSENRLWICSYCDNGLICLGQGDAMTVYNVENSGLASNRVRCSAELSDGTIAVGTAEGISFLSDGQVVGSLTARDGLLNPQILSLAEGEDGILYAGTDGSGLYGIRNQAIVTHYGKREGLSSDVVLRVVPYEGGIFLVDSNALCYLKDGEIRILEGFPYFNNFDIQFYDDTAYVLSSAGIYEVSAKELCRGGDMDYTLYTEGDGLAASLTANSWNYMDEYGMLYLCTNSGVTRFDKWRQSQSVEYRYGLTSVSCDGVEAERDGDTWTLPASARRVEVTASVRNYKLSSEKVRIFVRGMEEQGILTDFDELDSLVLTGLTAGTYKVCLQIMDAKGETVEQEKVFTLIKKRQIWENGWYKAYLYGVLLEVLFYAAWSLGIILQSRRQKSEMEKMQAVLEEKVDIQTKVIRLQQEETKHLFSQTVMALSDAVDAKDRYTSGHSKRVAHYAALIAEKMGKSEEEKEKIHRAALLHDIGKIRIPEHIINKTSRLTDDEFELIKVHPIVGYHVLNRIPGETTLAQGAKFHHEWYDGSGYPEGLKGKDIPEVARIIGVADSYDAMASNRSYRSALPQDVVRREIEKGKGVQFDPEIADIMLQLIDADKDYTMKQTEELKQYILVVDDEPENIRMVEQMLADEPMYEITSAESGPEALELLQKKEFHLVLLDVDMPEMDGFETLAHIREFSSVPVVLMSVERDGTLLEKIVEYDAADCLTKPLLPLSLKEVFHSMLNGLEMG